MTTLTSIKFEDHCSNGVQHTFVNQQQIARQPEKESDLLHWQAIVLQLMEIVAVQNAIQSNYNGVCSNRLNKPLIKLPVLENQFLQSFKHYILDHIDETDMNVNKISKAMRLSRSQLHRKIKSLTNLSITQLINMLKIHVAKNLLLTTNYTVSEIAYETGFLTLSYFSRVFHKIVHCSPSQYRKQGKDLLMQQ